MAPRRSDRVFLALLAVLLGIGLVMLTSATGPVAYQKFQDPYWYVRHQALFGLLPGIVLFTLCARTDYRVLRGIGIPALVASFVLLTVVFVPGLAGDWGTSRSWIRVGGFSFQPVELAKLTFLVFLAGWLESRGEDLRGTRTGLLPFVAIVGAVGLLIMLQPDLGSLLVIAAMSFVAYYLAGAPWSHMIGLGVLGAGALALLVRAVPYRAARFMTFLHPELDPLGVGYHINQAFLAIGSGGLFGLGLGHSRQKYLYLPEVIGDSFFAVMAEELGFFVVLAVLALFVAFLFRGLRIAKHAPDRFGRFLAGGIVCWVFVQLLFNVGSMVGLLPITGLPLPFMSYGGSALISLMAAMGIMTNISRHSAVRGAN